MSTRPKILVTSATGKTETPTVLQLLEKGYPVRAFVRKLDHRSEAVEKAGAEIFVGNQYSISDMRLAMGGVKRAYQCAPAAPNPLYFYAAFTAAAYEADFERVVTLDQWLSTADHHSPMTPVVYMGDNLIKMRPEMTVTTINVGWFADNYMNGLEVAAQLGVFSMPFGDGELKKNAAPSNEDIASVAVGALIDPVTHAGKTYRPTGPEIMSPNEIAAAMGRALGRKVKYRDVPERMMLKAFKAGGTQAAASTHSESGAYQVRLYADEYRRGAFGVNALTGDVESVGGRTPENLESIIRRYVAERPDLKPTFTGKLKAIAAFVKILITRAPDLENIAANNNFVMLDAPTYSQ